MDCEHRLSPQHINRYVNKLVERHSLRDRNTIDQLAALAPTSSVTGCLSL